MKCQNSEFRDPKGKSVVNYGNIMEKLNISREQAEAKAKKMGVIIPEEQFAVLKKTRGRPKKETSVTDTDSEISSASVKKPRGRPKKNEKKLESMPSSDIELLSELDSDSDSDEEEVKVVEIEFLGEIYYKSISDSKVYNKDSEEVGYWDEDNREIKRIWW